MRFNPRSRLVLAAATALLSARAGHAANWINPLGGSFTEPQNWSNQTVPGPTDEAVFNLGSTTGYTVELLQSLTNRRLVVANDSLFLDLPSEPPVAYTLTDLTGPSVIVGNNSGDVGQLTIGSGTLASSSAAIGYLMDSSGQVLIGSSSATWNNAGALFAGDNGSGSLAILSGAQVTSASASIGRLDTADGSVSIDGAGSLWNTAGLLIVGEAGAGTLTVSNSAWLQTGTLTVAAQGVGVVSIDSDGSIGSAGALNVAEGDQSIGTLSIASGSLTSASAVLARDAGSLAWVSLDGPQSTWNSGALTIGSGGAANLDLAAGAKLTAASLSMAAAAGSVSSLNLDGAGTLLDGSAGPVTLAGGGNADLSISAGAVMTSASATLAHGSGSLATAGLTDAGSKWSVSGDFIVADEGSASISVENGARLETGRLSVGQAQGSDGTLNLSTAASLAVANTLWIGVAGTGALQLDTGASATIASAIIGVGTPAQGSVLLDASSLTITGELVVGAAGTGSLTVHNAATLATGSAFVGQFSGGKGTVALADAGTSWNTGPLTIGSDSPGSQGRVSISSAASLNVSGPLTIASTGRLSIDNAVVSAAKIELAGGTLAGNGAIATLLEGSGFVEVAGQLALAGPLQITQSLTKTGPGPLQITGPQNHAPGSSLTVATGALEMNTDAGASGSNLKIIVAGGATAAFGTTQHLAQLALADSASAAFAPAGNRFLVADDLSIAPTGTVDLADNDAIIHSTLSSRASDLTRISSYIRSARNASTRWTGPGLTSTSAKSNPDAGLVIVLNDKGDGTPIVTDFGGESVGVTDILVKYSWNGDVNVDGRINADDYFYIDSGYLAHPAQPTYREGDFNFDGKINADDYFLIDSAFLNQTGVLGTMVAVPEPGWIGLIAAGGLLLLRRRG